ncbi:hypothetical protein KCMC57_up62030 [Kitasatospora sp. CMC57]|uniref:WXG100 family type VII secretion target n=1 Tax=Kitasatospora sp. CMC57 TaxID=3231513 RepID=A0AB33K2V4_9ACTN
MEEQQLRQVDAVQAADPVAARVAADAVEPAEPALARLEPMQAGEPMTARVAADALQPTTARLEPMQVGEPMTARATTDAVRIAAQPVESSKRLAASGTPAGGGDAGQGFQVDPEQYRAAVGPVLAGSDQLNELTRGLNAYLSGMNARAPWGNDDSGEKFANGEKGYLTYSGKVLEGLGNLPTALKYIADGIKAMAESYDNAEEALSTGLTSMEAELPETALFHPDLALRDIAQGRPHHTGRP